MTPDIAALKVLKVCADDPHPATVCFNNEDARAIISALEAAEERSLANNVLAYNWMVRHDRIMAGKDGGPFPTPADVPNLLARAETEQEREKLLKRVQALEEALEPFATPHLMGDAYVKFAPRLLAAARATLEQKG